MVTVVVRVRLPDVEAWLAEYERMHLVRATCGERQHQAFQDVLDPGQVTVIFEWDEEANARAYFRSAALVESVARVAMLAPPEVTVLVPIDNEGRRVTPQPSAPAV